MVQTRASASVPAAANIDGSRGFHSHCSNTGAFSAPTGEGDGVAVASDALRDERSSSMSRMKVVSGDNSSTLSTCVPCSGPSVRVMGGGNCSPSSGDG